MDRHQSKKKFAYYCRARPDNLPLPAVAVADFYRNDGENLANIKQRRSKSYWVILNPFSFPFFPANIESGFTHAKKKFNQKYVDSQQLALVQLADGAKNPQV